MMLSSKNHHLLGIDIVFMINTAIRYKVSVFPFYCLFGRNSEMLCVLHSDNLTLISEKACMLGHNIPVLITDWKFETMDASWT